MKKIIEYLQNQKGVILTIDGVKVVGYASLEDVSKIGKKINEIIDFLNDSKAVTVGKKRNIEGRKITNIR